MKFQGSPPPSNFIFKGVGICLDLLFCSSNPLLQILLSDHPSSAREPIRAQDHLG